MEMSRYASRLAPTSAASPSGRPTRHIFQETGSTARPASSFQVPLRSSVDLPQEPEDARLTGGTRSLSRRLLALNIPGLSIAKEPLARNLKVVSAKLQKKPKTLPSGADLLPQDA